jgi:hypothetical protein
MCTCGEVHQDYAAGWFLLGGRCSRGLLSGNRLEIMRLECLAMLVQVGWLLITLRHLKVVGGIRLFHDITRSTTSTLCT